MATMISDKARRRQLSGALRKVDDPTQVALLCPVIDSSELR
jgi:hypothetical protein